MNGNIFSYPPINSNQIEWAAKILGLEDDAFLKMGDDDPRARVIKEGKTVDISACPGSGKTTLLVAKLAILIKNWNENYRGICVLSHTNVAKDVIKTRIGGLAIGKQLLSYPHFVGTIHSFIGEFFAIPWLRSKGYPINVINTEKCAIYRMNLIPSWVVKILQGIFRKDIIYFQLLNSSFDFSTPENKIPSTHKLYPIIKNALARSTREGYYCYDDLFFWANDLLDHHEFLIDIIRDRFPILFIDEAQDNNDLQSKILYRVFKDGDSKIIRQRFGDQNQAIYSSSYEKSTTYDVFPSDEIMEVPNSLRFNQSIANICDPLGISPIHIVGDGPRNKNIKKTTEAKCKNTVFIFNEKNIDKVLESYAKKIVETFSSEELEIGSFVAVGQVHNDNNDQHIPRHVKHYWRYYEPNINSDNSKPKTFLDYLDLGNDVTARTGDYFPLIEKIAEGILTLASIQGGKGHIGNRRYLNRFIQQLLVENKDILDIYNNLIYSLAFRENRISREEWDDNIKNELLKIAGFIAGVPIGGDEITQFLEWTDPYFHHENPETSPKFYRNVYFFQENGKKVNIKLGSIHSVKGETHTAVLILETFWYKHNLESLLPWFLGEKNGGSTETDRTKTRMRIHYVAMTRPSHLLCIALKDSSILNKKHDVDSEILNKLEEKGWKIEIIS